jgi:hypothetical protein
MVVLLVHAANLEKLDRPQGWNRDARLRVMQLSVYPCIILELAAEPRQRVDT